MKPSGTFAASSVLLLIAFLISPWNILAQEKTPATSENPEKNASMLTSPCLFGLQTETPRITVGEFGKGLQYYKIIVLQKQGSVKMDIWQPGKKSEMGKRAISDAEMYNLRQNMLFIDKKCQSMMKKWVRDERWDLNLGEMIKGYYQKPVF